jgi:hypothetical protein
MQGSDGAQGVARVQSGFAPVTSQVDVGIEKASHWVAILGVLIFVAQPNDT